MKFDEIIRKAIEEMKNYDWKDLERGMRKVQKGINMLTAYFLAKGDANNAYISLGWYFDVIKVFKAIRETIEQEKLLTEEDIEIIEYLERED